MDSLGASRTVRPFVPPENRRDARSPAEQVALGDLRVPAYYHSARMYLWMCLLERIEHNLQGKVANRNLRVR